MGQENSTPIDESVPPERLESRTLEGIAKYLLRNDDIDRDVRGCSGDGKLGKRVLVLVIKSAIRVLVHAS